MSAPSNLPINKDSPLRVQATILGLPYANNLNSLVCSADNFFSCKERACWKKVVSASMYVTGSDFYTLRLNQLFSGSVCQELYRGLIFATTESAVVRNSEPLSSYTGSTTAQKLNEYIIWNP